MILTDAGPLVAILDQRDPDHAKCVEALESLTGPMLTTWPAFTEAMYLLGTASPRWAGQEALWRLVQRGDVGIAYVSGNATQRMADLMHKYRDTPMDLADASLVTVAEERGLARIFTLDGHLKTYRLANRKTLAVLP